MVGDLHEPLLGIDPETIAALREQGIAHFFHLAAIYDMTAGAEVNQLANVEGTHHALELADAVGARLLASRLLDRRRRHLPGRLHRGHVRRRAAARPSLPPHEVRVRAARARDRDDAVAGLPALDRVGDSRTGRIDKVDGPYYFFPLLKRAHRLVPDWLPLIGPELGNTNLVPVDFVAAALDHIAHQPGLNRQAFHLTDPNSCARRRRAEHVRQGRRTRRSSPSRVDPGPLAAVRAALAAALMSLPGAQRRAGRCWPRSGSPTRSSTTST